MGSLGLTCDQVKINFPVGLPQNMAAKLVCINCVLDDEVKIVFLCPKWPQGIYYQL
jgi:hypothetical protein